MLIPVVSWLVELFPAVDVPGIDTFIALVQMLEFDVRHAFTVRDFVPFPGFPSERMKAGCCPRR